ncbi:MAG: hypothetical protein NTW28_20815 [Candidatus Solibacter sp.]|nr:hypothetical protein [Candidatus Solibacter sp.]
MTYTVRGSTDLANWYDIARKTGAGAWVWLGGGAERITSVEPTPGRSPVEIGIPQAHEADPVGFPNDWNQSRLDPILRELDLGDGRILVPCFD